ncbi:beta-Ig-H3/fasciclin [Psychrobacter sp. Sarcosine-02u-2]|uniref:fasciclin domain-containing protein n=1 Tax=Psychrobacter sp. Sarcosine-02u-2 TaxID=2058324 RepID=UPI000C7C6521|nr:fasciclin domain-containing protein [Psychrobacter sp. Sarcosine-02u-2]PKG83338.1 beta-Ig-H3/fasciclin [Psychrobacter sp. Sarcosine-02u-2]
MLKKNLLSIAVVTAAMSLAACNDKEAVTEPVEPAATTDVAVEPETTTDMPAEAVAESNDAMAVDAAATQSIGEMAAGNENLTILTEALQAADLDDMMMAEGQYTVFAPTDDAFAALLTKLNVTKEQLLGDKEMLTSVLTYHVVPMVVKAADIPYGTAIDTANGQTISISDANVITDASGNTANIVGTDMMATNGVVHVIDTVLLPK